MVVCSSTPADTSGPSALLVLFMPTHFKSDQIILFKALSLAFYSRFSQLGTFPARLGPEAGSWEAGAWWMTHRFLGIPRLRKCSRRHTALPLAGQALTGCWLVENNTLRPPALSKSIRRACLHEPQASTISHIPS